MKAERHTRIAIEEAFYDGVWGIAVRARNLAKRLGMLGPLEPAILKLAPLLIRPPSTDVEVPLPFRMRMVVPAGYPSARSFTAGVYEPEVTHLFKDILKEGMVVVDLGANVGYYTLLASRLVGNSGRVYAFEPDPKAYTYLVGNAEKSGCHNVIAHRKAVAAGNGTMTFVRDPQGAEGFLTEEAGNNDSTIVETVSLDAFFAAEGWPSVHLVKIDIEGGENAALHGMRELSRRNPGMRLIMEMNLAAMYRAGATQVALATILHKLGFDDGYIIEQGMKPFSVSEAFPESHATYNLLLVQGEGRAWL